MGRARGNFFGGAAVRQAVVVIAFRYEVRRNDGVLQVEGMARDRENNDTRYGVESSESDLDRRAKHMRFLDAGVEPTGTK